MDNEDTVEKIRKANDEGSILGYRFSNVGTLIRAFTRAGYAKEARDKTKIAIEDQNPLATLGDAVLKAALADIIFHSGQKTAEQITKEKEKREKDPAIAKVADEEGLWRLIRFGGSEKRGKLDKQESILATTIEAVIGALYLDTGCDIARTREVIAQYF